MLQGAGSAPGTERSAQEQLLDEILPVALGPAQGERPCTALDTAASIPRAKPGTALLLTSDSGKITHKCFHCCCSANDTSTSASSAAEDRVLSLIGSGRA